MPKTTKPLFMVHNESFTVTTSACDIYKCEFVITITSEHMKFSCKAKTLDGSSNNSCISLYDGELETTINYCTKMGNFVLYALHAVVKKLHYSCAKIDLSLHDIAHKLCVEELVREYLDGTTIIIGDQINLSMVDTMDITWVHK